jgi:hypothetical protein
MSFLAKMSILTILVNFDNFDILTFWRFWQFWHVEGDDFWQFWVLGGQKSVKTLKQRIWPKLACYLNLINSS